MKTPLWPEGHTARALEIWADYCRDHEITHLIGSTVGIEPESAKLWFGESATDVAKKKLAEGIEAPIYCLRVGRDYYLRKGRYG